MIGITAVPLNGSGIAALPTSSLAVGSDTITAVYSGDSNYNGSSATPFTQVINKANTATGLTSSGTPSNSGISVTHSRQR